MSLDEKESKDQAIRSQVLTQQRIENASSVFTYVSTDAEVATHQIIEELANSGKKVLVPKILSKTRIVAVPFTTWDDMEAGPLGILAPRATLPFPDPIDVAIVPGVGFTVAGSRLGFGAGYYDRWFAQNPTTWRIAIAYETQICESMPEEPHDIPMQCVITESRIVTTCE